MPFSSLVFLFCFLPSALGLQLVLPRRWRNAALLLFSLGFYAWGEQEIVLVMLASIAGNYALGRALGRAGPTVHGRALVAGAVVFNLGILGYFKYAGFFIESIVELLGLEGAPALRIALPIGVSFYTFQALSYIVDVYRRQAPPQESFVDFALYIALFPQLVAGPIVRYRDIAAQLPRRVVTAPGFAAGVRRFTVGLGKKVLVADTVAIGANAVFDDVPAGDLTAGLAWFGVLCYTIQIYFDFSGYSDMAIGLGRMLGLRFLENFDYPYVSRSVTEFWRRWHISLSTWFRDYLYIPLGGNRAGRVATYRNLLIVFFLCGLWHGASWSFVVWGLYHGTFLILERLKLGARPVHPPRIVSRAYTLLVVVVGWVFFRAETLAGARTVLAAMAGLGAGDGREHHVMLYLRPHVALAFAAGVLGSVPWLHRAQELLDRRPRGSARSVAAAMGNAGLLGVFLLCAASLAAGTSSPFIYFRF